MERLTGVRVVEATRPFVVYQLIFPDDPRLAHFAGAIYVGQGNCARPFEHRVNGYNNYKQLPRYQAINRLWQLGLDYVTELLYECETKAEACGLERATIQRYRAAGLPLLNG